jgi:outer membrane biosynthesis protein TonB
MFHGEAIKAAMKWRYKPASIEGTNVPSQNRIIFNFNLKK